MESGVYIEGYLTLGAFASGFTLVGAGIGITIYRFNLARFLSHISVDKLQVIIEETGRLYEAKWKREREHRNRLNLKTVGKHLAGVPSRRNVVEEVREEFNGMKEPNESRKL